MSVFVLDRHDQDRQKTRCSFNKVQNHSPPLKSSLHRQPEYTVLYSPHNENLQEALNIFVNMLGKSSCDLSICIVFYMLLMAVADCAPGYSLGAPIQELCHFTTSMADTQHF